MRNGLLMLVLVMGISALLYTWLAGSTPNKDVGWGQFLSNVSAGKVTSVDQQDQKLTVKGTDQSTYTVIAPVFPGLNVDVLEKIQAAAAAGGVPFDQNQYKVETAPDNSWLGLVLTGLLPLIIIGGFIFFMMRQAQGTNNQAMSFGKSRARMFLGNKQVVTFNDVAGVDEAKTELQEVVEFLKYPEKFNTLGARIPRGVLLVGPPGTGKTLMARAVAGEAGVPFFSISGSEFVEMFVGVGASRVRDLFDQAKRNSPCIVFVDEIDAVGRQRGAGLGGSHDEREQTLNQILVEMDGFDTNTNVIVVAATSTDRALAGFVFNVLLIARAPLQLFQAIQTSLLPHLTGLEASDDADSFERTIRLTLLVIAGFAGLVALGLLAIGPFAMKVLFGHHGHYERIGLAAVGLGMGIHLVAGTLNQAALARGRAALAAAAWLLCAGLFVGWVASSFMTDPVRRVEAGYLGATLLLSGMLYALYRRPGADESRPASGLAVRRESRRPARRRGSVT